MMFLICLITMEDFVVESIVCIVLLSVYISLEALLYFDIFNVWNLNALFDFMWAYCLLSRLNYESRENKTTPWFITKLSMDFIYLGQYKCWRQLVFSLSYRSSLHVLILRLACSSFHHESWWLIELTSEHIICGKIENI